MKFLIAAGTIACLAVAAQAIGGVALLVKASKLIDNETKPSGFAVDTEAKAA
jgi:hypothetical protein